MLVKNLWFIAALLFTPYANSQPVDLDGLVGTLGVEFQPIQISGLQTGCTLVFKTIVRDHAYRKGELVALAGNISFQSFGSNIILGLKVGLADNFLVALTPMRSNEFERILISSLIYTKVI